MKKTITILSLIGLITNITPLLAGTLQIEVLPGGYTLTTLTEVNLPEVPVSTQEKSSEISFSSNNSPNNFVKVTNENGNEPIDITVSANQFKRLENFSTTVANGSSNNSLHVASTTGLNIDDTINIEGENNILYKVTAIYTDAKILTISPSLSEIIPVTGAKVLSFVNCDISPKKCISLNNFKIKSSLPNTIYGDPLITTDYLDYQSFGGETTTMIGSIGNSLQVSNPSVFQTGEEISLIATNGIPTNYIIGEIFLSDPITAPGTISLIDANFGNGTNQIIPPIANQKVRSSVSRNVTLAKSKGETTSQSTIDPTIKLTIDAGQMQGKFTSTLNFTII